MFVVFECLKDLRGEDYLNYLEIVFYLFLFFLVVMPDEVPILYVQPVE